mmetsp:Transcript_4569/g.10761  ORF Transcript_4569/g.10761 Transcript_4569/m.10761 type:complete len:239 (-) Transcript_4569:909-1625(-)
MVRSLLPEATWAPLGLQSSAYTSSAWPGNVCCAAGPAREPSFPAIAIASLASHTLMVESLDAEHSSRESIAHATLYTAPTCPTKVAKNPPVRPSHTLTFLSNEAEAKNRPSGEKAMSFTACWWPVMRATGCFPSEGRHRKSEKSSEALTSRSTSASWPPPHWSYRSCAAACAASWSLKCEVAWSKGPVRHTYSQLRASALTRWPCPASVRTSFPASFPASPATVSTPHTLIVRSRLPE